MIFEYDDLQITAEDAPPPVEEPMPDAETELFSAKAFLQKCSNITGDNLYDHLTDVLNKILAERPENVIDFFEEYSRKMKEMRFKPMTDHLEDIYVAPGRYALARKVMPLLRPPRPIDGPAMDPEDEELADMTRNDMLQLCYFFEQAGMGLPRDSMFYLMLSMRKLIRTEPIATIKFWGKIQGLYKDYLIIETELKEEEYIKRNELAEATLTELALDPGGAGDDETKALEDIAIQEGEGEGGSGLLTKVPRRLPPEPKIVYEEPPEAPTEASGVGANKKVYYVCHETGDEWYQLPDVTPKQIRVSRQIKKSFTGILRQEIVTYPDFPGCELNYLRAQIARISAGTQISPLGFYTFKDAGGGEEEEEEEEEEGAPEGGMKTTYKENSKFDGVPIRDLIDQSMSFWVHNTLYLLPQGRTSWWNPVQSEGGEEVDEELGEEEGGKPGVIGPEPETGPPLLTPLTEDASVEAVPPWSVRTSSGLLQDYAIAIVRSHIWPGAYCFATQGKIFHNIYLGFGHKYVSHNFTPVPLPPVEQDYPLGPEIMEITDPTGAQEEEWRIAHLPKPPPIKLAGEGEEEQAPEEEEEEDE